MIGIAWRSGGRWILLLALCLITSGCMSRRPSAFPAAPEQVQHQSDGSSLSIYGAAGARTARYAELTDPSGFVTELRFDNDNDGDWDEIVDRRQLRPERHLILILDSVPFEMVHDAQLHSRFGLFHAPARIVSPFPSMTDMSLNEFLGSSPSPAMESDFFDGEHPHSGWKGYSHADNSPWFNRVDWRLPYRAHGWAYFHPQQTLLTELAAVERALAAAPDGDLIAYLVGPSSLGFSEGRAGHLFGLAQIDRFCHSLMHRYRGRLAITLMSDHGHYLETSRMVQLRHLLELQGYRITDTPRAPDDVFVADFGLISCAAVYTQVPARVAGDLVRADGVELALYRDHDAVVVLSRDGRARISQCAGGYAYTPEAGDPLQLLPVLEQLPGGGTLGADACIADDALFAATIDHRYPDPLDRCWRAFHGLMEYPPDVLLSLAPGHHWGSPFIDAHIRAEGIHGNLNRLGTLGFVMSTEGTVPDPIRMRDLAEQLAKIGVNAPAQRHATAAAD